jgi:hypothetical protein
MAIRLPASNISRHGNKNMPSGKKQCALSLAIAEFTAFFLDNRPSEIQGVSSPRESHGPGT